MSVSLSFAMSASVRAVTLTVCGEFQVDLVKVTEVLFSERSVPGQPPMVTVTLPVGCVSNLTV